MWRYNRVNWRSSVLEEKAKISEMDPFAGNLSTTTGANRKFFNPGTETSKNESKTGAHAHSIDNNLQLVHLLTTNPAAALPAFFPATRTSTQNVYARQPLQMTRPRTENFNTSSWRRGETNSTGIRDFDKIHANPWTASLMSEKLPFRRQRSFSELYVSKEDIEKKACCIDRDGYFDFEVLLPAVYWNSIA